MAIKNFISFSGGVESTTMCVLFGKDADAIFSDTGFEHDEIYKRIELVEILRWCRDFRLERGTYLSKLPTDNSESTVLRDGNESYKRLGLKNINTIINDNTRSY